MRIVSIHLQNFKSFRDAHIDNIPGLCVLVGANGTGKTTLLDVFGFLQDCMTFDVTKALQKRGGFREVIWRGAKPGAAIEIDIVFEVDIANVAKQLQYSVQIGEAKQQAVVLRESLKSTSLDQSPVFYLDFAKGDGNVLDLFGEPDPGGKTNHVELMKISADTLAASAVGRFKKYDSAFTLRDFISNWHLSDIRVDATRDSKPGTGIDDHLSGSGDNLPQMAHKLYRHHPEVFQSILQKMQRAIPGISNIVPKLTEDGRLLLQFSDGQFTDPFLERHVSDGTIKMFAYLVLLHDPHPHPLLCVEEPENQLYPRLLQELAEEFRAYGRRGGQVFVSTHSPDFLNALEVDEVVWLVKRQGASEFVRARDNEQIANYMANGDQMGYLWSEGLFPGVDPR